MITTTASQTPIGRSSACIAPWAIPPRALPAGTPPVRLRHNVDRNKQGAVGDSSEGRARACRICRSRKSAQERNKGMSPALVGRREILAAFRKDHLRMLGAL